MTDMKTYKMDTVAFVAFSFAICHSAYGQVNEEPNRYSVTEELPSGTPIGNVGFDARRLGKLGASPASGLTYTIVTDQPLFVMDLSSGALSTRVEIDRDVLCPGLASCAQTFDVAVSPTTHFAMIALINVEVEILDENDNNPRFLESEMAVDVLETDTAGTSITLPIRNDPDSPANGPDRYQIEPPTSVFDLHEEISLDGSVELQLVLTGQLDREQQDFYQIQVVVFDGGNPSRRGSMLVNVTVQDANDNHPVFSNTTYRIYVPENLGPNATILTVSAHDADITHNGEIRYALFSNTAVRFGHLFGIDPVTGDIYVKEVLDAEDVTLYHLVVTARDSGRQAKSSQASVFIHVQDINDNSPQISVFTGESAGRITEGEPMGTFVAHVSVVDRDRGLGGQVSCSVNDTNFQVTETPQASQYRVISNNMFDREERSRYTVLITCTDHGSPAKSSNYDLTINVQDINDKAPVFSQSLYRARIPENNPPNTSVLRVFATDQDLGANAEVQYSLVDSDTDYFQIDDETGIISVTDTLDYERLQNIEFFVVAQDKGDPPMSATATVTIVIQDQNDNPPVFIMFNYSFGICENMDPHTHVGVVSAFDTDSPEFSEVHYKLQSHDQYVLDTFGIDERSGEIFTKMQLDRESIAVYQVQVAAFNPGFDQTSTATVTIYIADANDNTPEFDFPSVGNDTVLISNLVPYGHVVTRVRAHDNDIGDNAKLTFALIQGNEEGVFDIDERTGALTVIKDLSDVSSIMYNLSVEVVDNGNNSKTAIHTLHVDVNSSIPFAFNGLNNSNGGKTSNFNVMIVIGVGCASGAIIVALVIAILAIRLQDGHRKKDRRYNCRTEAQKMLYIAPGGLSDGLSTPSDKEHPSDPPVPDIFGLHTAAVTKSPVLGSDLSHGSVHSVDNNIQMGTGPLSTSSRTSSFNESGSTLSKYDTGRSRQHRPRDASLQRIAPCQASSSQPITSQLSFHPDNSTLTEPASLHGYVSHNDSFRSDRRQGTPVSHCFPAHAAAVNKHQLGHILENTQVHVQPMLWSGDQDSESACSGDMSNTDSGRGGSEEGEAAHNKHHEIRFLDLTDTSKDRINKVGCHGNTSTSDDSGQCSLGRHQTGDRKQKPGLRVLDAPSKRQTNPSCPPPNVNDLVGRSSGLPGNTNGTTNTTTTFTGPQPLPHRHKLLPAPGTSRFRPPPPSPPRSPPRSPHSDSSWQRGRHLNPRVTPRGGTALPQPWTDLAEDDASSSATSGSYMIDDHLTDGATEV